MLRALLVHVDASERCHARLVTARNLARQHNARLTALFADLPRELDTPYAYAAGSTAAQWLQQMEHGRRCAARQRFDAVLGRDGDAIWSELSGDALALGVARQALYTDLVVLGQHDSAGVDAPALPDDFVETVIIAGGRPALIVPRRASPPQQLHTIVVAWKPSKSAAHALAGSLPLLRQAREVHVVSWAESAAPDAHSADGVLGYLQSHGVRTHWQQHAKAPRDICDALLSHCALVEADLLVMGCYSHGRMRERLLGGLTREMLRSMRLPVLMAH